MSWNDYVNGLTATEKIDKAAIFSSSGDCLWAETGGFKITIQESEAISEACADPTEFQAVGFHVEGLKYFLLRAEDRSLYGKLDETGIVVVKTKETMIVAHYPSGVQPQEATALVEKLADYLIGVGY